MKTKTKKDKHYVVLIKGEDQVNIYENGERDVEVLDLHLITSTNKSKLVAFIHGMRFSDDFLLNLGHDCEDDAELRKYALKNLSPYRV